jgi:hypothetical protein
VFVNDGTGLFTEMGEAAGLISGRASGTMSLADVDGDGDLDLYVANYKIGSADDQFEPDELTFEEIVRQVGDTFRIAPRFRRFYAPPSLGRVFRGESPVRSCRRSRLEIPERRPYREALQLLSWPILSR